QMTGAAQMQQMFAAVTTNGAKVLGLEDYGLEPGCHADLVILQAADPREALRLKPARLFVIRRGNVIAETPPVVSRLAMGGSEYDVDFNFPPESN
ncbi:MAG: amidohydrolase family protein, partial [Deltaproteobacteria bacterium]|nr:amidohydrolase family protein [Deltaproteobacteria bacterium]